MYFWQNFRYCPTQLIIHSTNDCLAHSTKALGECEGTEVEQGMVLVFMQCAMHKDSSTEMTNTI